jgi:hypothetical protein
MDFWTAFPYWGILLLAHLDLVFNGTLPKI